MNDALNLLNRLCLTKKGTPLAEFLKDGYKYTKEISVHKDCEYCNHAGLLNMYKYIASNGEKATADFCPKCGSCISESWVGGESKSYMDYNY